MAEGRSTIQGKDVKGALKIMGYQMYGSFPEPIRVQRKKKTTT